MEAAKGFLALIGLLCFLLSIWVLIRPFKLKNASLQGRGKQFMLLWVAIIGTVILRVPLTDEVESASTDGTPAITDTSAPAKAMPGIGEAASGRYFEYTVHSATLTDEVRTGNQFSDLPMDPGNNYMVVDVTVRNIDDEGRMIDDGALLITTGGKEYEYDTTETVMLEGWGFLLDSINPMVTKRGKIVWKIPAGLSGTIVWQPGREGGDFGIMLGSLDGTEGAAAN